MINLEFLKTKEIKTGKNQEVVNYINSLYKSTSDMYLKQHKDWYISDRFVRGDHWIVYNKTLNKVQTIPIAAGEVRRTINKIRSQLRGIKNFIKRSQPRWEVHPNGIEDSAYDEAAAKNKILQNVFRKTQMRQKMTDLIVNSLKYSAGFLEGGYVKKNGKEVIDFWVDSSYDILPDPYAQDLQNCRYYFKTFVKPVEAVKGNPEYDIKDTDELSDNREAASDYKNILELEKYNKESNKTNKDLETTIVKELWMKWTDSDNETKLRVITVVGNNIARVYSPKYRRYPLFVYNPERNEESIFSQPWIKDLISINKSLDKTASQVETYVQRMLAGKYLIKKGVEVSMITDKGAEKIYYKGNVPPKQMDLQPLPSTPFTYMGDLERWIEELGGVREASLGRAAGSLQSGKGIEALQSADAGTVAEPIENLELLLQNVGEFILELIADHKVTSESIVEDGDEVKYIGSAANAKIDGAITINGEDEVKVTIVPEVAYSEDARKEWTMRLAEAQLIDPQTLLEQFKFSNIGDIVERMEKNKEEDFRKDMIKQRESHRTDGNGPEDTADFADQENMQMASGQEVPDTPKALWTPEHTQLHIAFIKENSDAYKQNQQLFDSHITVEEQYE
jgi:hypothetical protein